ncbi:plasmid pRiA4b ORF-3 family protein [Mesorhizobium carmichaelinearum]|uniref:plasmid pRiA4b ORF-3 family protein n=1 Tax=Mesorhizobium carmichaelinearum TaxID=1208188 RepID=UPI001FCEE48D|nr:plasmid pRiA4b ORF-3 family protein [Mesorhizobium carmichaelinearum]
MKKFLTLDPIPRTAACIDGARARPPEDVGGISGFENFLAIMGDRDDPEYRDVRRWCGGHFDPEWFDLTVVDRVVRSALKPNVRRRLHQPKPKRGAGERAR